MSFPDATALLIAYLDPLLPSGVAVHSSVPNPRPEHFVQVRRVGGVPRNVVRDKARMDFFAWHHADEAQAMSTLLTVRGYIWALAGNKQLGVTCYRVQEFLGPRQLNDPETGTPRAWMTAELDLRADQIIHYTPPPEDES
jgi:hypothetical protein